MTAPQWTNALWNRLTTLIDDMVGACIKVYLQALLMSILSDDIQSLSGLYVRKSVEAEERSRVASSFSG